MGHRNLKWLLWKLSDESFNVSIKIRSLRFTRGLFSIYKKFLSSRNDILGFSLISDTSDLFLSLHYILQNDMYHKHLHCEVTGDLCSFSIVRHEKLTSWFKKSPIDIEIHKIAKLDGGHIDYLHHHHGAIVGGSFGQSWESFIMHVNDGGADPQERQQLPAEFLNQVLYCYHTVLQYVSI